MFLIREAHQLCQHCSDILFVNTALAIWQSIQQTVRQDKLLWKVENFESLTFSKGSALHVWYVVLDCALSMNLAGQRVWGLQHSIGQSCTSHL